MEDYVEKFRHISQDQRAAIEADLLKMLAGLNTLNEEEEGQLAYPASVMREREGSEATDEENGIAVAEMAGFLREVRRL